MIKCIAALRRKKAIWTAGIMAVFLACMGIGQVVRAETLEEENTIRIGFPVQQNLMEIDEDGKYSGYTYDYLIEIQKYTGWHYDFVQIEGTLDEQLMALLEMLQTGEIDIMGTMSYSDALATIYDYPGTSYGTTYYALCADKDNTNLTSSNYYLREHLKIGVLSSRGVENEQLNQFCNMNAVEVEQIFYSSEEELYAALDRGEIEALLSKDVALPKGKVKVLARYGPQPFYFAVTKGETQLVNQLEAALNQIAQNEPYFTTDLWNAYFSEDEGEATFTDAERDYIREHPVIKAVAFGGRPPIQMIEEDGCYSGVSLEVLDYITEISGLQFDLTMTEAFDEYERLVTQGDAELLVGVYDDMQQFDWQYMVTTVAYMDAPLSIVLGPNTDMEQLRGSHLALLRGIQYNGEYNGKVSYYETPLACMQAVRNGEADYCYVNTYSVQYYMNQLENSGLVVVPQNDKWSQEFCMGVKDSSDIHLINILNKVIRQLNQTEQMQIYLFRNAYHPEEITISDYFRRNPMQSITLALVALMTFVVIIMYIIYKSEKRTLRVHRTENERYELLSGISNEYVFNYVVKSDRMELSEKCSYYLKLPRQIEHITQWDGEGSEVLRTLLEARDKNEEYQLTIPGQESRWVRVISQWVRDEAGKPLYLVGKLVDIQKEREERQRLRNKAEHDGLTGVYNMATFREKITEMYQTLDAEQYAFFIMDIDYFKQVNDLYGHFAGDQLLRGIGEILREFFSSETSVAGRLGGDEFVMQAAYCGSQKCMEECCEQLCKRIREISFEGKKEPVTVSIGVAVIPREFDFEEGYKQADQILYEVKKTGRDGYKIAVYGEDQTVPKGQDETEGCNIR